MNLFELFFEVRVKDEATKNIEGLSSKLGKGLKTAAKIGAAAVTAVGNGIMALGTYATKVGSDFEAQMSKVSAISGATGDDLQALEDKAKQLGIDTKFSATEAGQAFEYMAMAGWKTEQMLDGVAGIMDLAAASGEDLAMVSDIVTDAMTAFGLSADQSTHFADVLAKASSSANTNVGLMGETFKYVAPVAGAMGFSIEDTATAIGLMANAGIKGSQAGTALRGMIARLVKPTEDSAAAMERLGISITNSDGTVKDFDTILGDLRASFSELGDAEKAETAALLAGQEAMSGMLAIVNASETDFNNLTKAINNADGSAKTMADTMANNLQGKLTLLKSSAEGFGLALYDKIQTPLTEMASWAVESLNELTTAFNEKGVDGVVEAAGNILSEAITAVVDKLPEFTELAVSVIESFVNGLSGNQKTLANGAVSIITTIVKKLTKLLPKITQSALDLIITLAEGLVDFLPNLTDSVVEIIVKIIAVLTDQKNLTKLLNAALAIVKELAWGLIENINTIIDAALTLFDGIIDFLVRPENLALLIETAIELVMALGTGVIKAIPQLLVSVGSLIASIFANFATADWASIGTDLVAGLKKGINNAWSNLKKWFKSLFGDLIGIAKKILGIASPSKVFAEIGRFMAEGVGVGWNDNFGDVKRDINNSLDFDGGYIGSFSGGADVSYGGGYGGREINVTQNIYSQAKTAADLMREARWQARMAVITGV